MRVLLTQGSGTRDITRLMTSWTCVNANLKL